MGVKPDSEESKRSEVGRSGNSASETFERLSPGLGERLGEGSSQLGSGVGSSELGHRGSGVESSERIWSGDGSSGVAAHRPGLDSSDLFAQYAGNMMSLLLGGCLSPSGAKNSLLPISDRGGVIGTSATVIVVVFFASRSSEKSVLTISEPFPLGGSSPLSSARLVCFLERRLRWIFL